MPDAISFWGQLPFFSFRGQLPFFAISFVIGYLSGSIPYGLLLTRVAGLGDVRDIGSGNIGATNVLRTGNKWLAAATLLTDAAKGGVVILIMWKIWGVDHAVVAGVAAFLGHVFPVWLKFKGGKGVATFLGIVLALYWPVGLLFAGTWIVTATVFRISSLAALVGTLAVPVYFWVPARFGGQIPEWLASAHGYQFAEVTLFLTALIWWAHRANIGRLIRGEEPRIGKK